jgi:hypothetical protein
MGDYNGWSNYETWCVNLWLTNEQGTYSDVESMVNELDDNFEDNDDVRREMAEWLKNYVEDLAEATCPGVIEGASFVADMFGSALGEVDWYELATSFMIDFEREDA